MARSQVLDGTKRNCVLLIAGQSNVSNNFPTPYTPTNSTKVDNLNCYDGGIYSAVDPLLGTARDGPSLGRGNFAGRLADWLINANKFDRVILVPIPVSGSYVADWVSGVASRRFAIAISRMAAKGLTPTAVLWGQGENDNFGGTTQAAYTTGLNSVITNARTAGIPAAVPWFIALQTWNSGTTSAAVRAAQTAVVNHSSAIWAGPDADTLGVSLRQADNTHLTDAGAAQYATLWLNALSAYGAPF